MPATRSSSPTVLRRKRPTLPRLTGSRNRWGTAPSSRAIIPLPQDHETHAISARASPIHNRSSCGRKGEHRHDVWTVANTTDRALRGKGGGGVVSNGVGLTTEMSGAGRPSCGPAAWTTRGSGVRLRALNRTPVVGPAAPRRSTRVISYPRASADSSSRWNRPRLMNSPRTVAGGPGYVG
jgi:hypothetical protein